MGNSDEDVLSFFPQNPPNPSKEPKKFRKIFDKLRCEEEEEQEIDTGLDVWSDILKTADRLLEHDQKVTMARAKEIALKKGMSKQKSIKCGCRNKSNS